MNPETNLQSTYPDITGFSPQEPFLVELFQRFRTAGIRYCVLGGSPNLPYDLGKGDLDILVPPDCIDRAEEIARTTALNHGGSCICRYRVELRLFCFCGRNGRGWWGAHVDLFPACAYRALPFLDTDTLLHNASACNGVRTASAEDAALYRCMKEVLFNRKPKKDYAEKAKNAFAVKPREIRKHLNRCLGAAAAESWCRALSVEKDAVDWKKLCRITRRALLIRTIPRHGLRLMRSKLQNIGRRIGRIFNPPGVTIAVLGTDGSGKTTLMRGMMPVLRNALNHKPRYEHMRPNLFPSLARLMRKPTGSGPTSNPHAGLPSGPVGSILRLSYYTLDYIFGYWFKVYPAMVKRPTIWLFDRYFYDYFIDPERGRIRLPKPIIHFLSAFIPKPDLILCLGTRPEIIHRRKPELPPEEVQRQVRELRAFCDGNRRAVWIDVGCSIEESSEHALEAVTSRMAARYA
ncbi:MAG: hypothetical protein JXR49_16545 [Acidobacteria bacterium]|nr:hypothetical protein [Acidobacteriota bacterium]